MPTFIKLTHIVADKKNRKKEALYVNVDQICRIGVSVDGAKDYATSILMANKEVYVLETVDEVMKLIPAQARSADLPAGV